ncbi:MAG: hypothetical protein WBE58_10720 [Verrucomicrobiales bacterium]
MRTFLAASCALFLTTLGSASDLPREWTSVDGRKVKAALSEADSTKVTLIVAGGRKVELTLDKLSQADRDYAKDWLANESKRATTFGLRVSGTRSTAVPTFLKQNSSSSGFSIGSKDLLSVTVTSYSGPLYTVKNTPGEVMLEVSAEMTAPGAPAGEQELDLSKLFLLYLNEDKTEGRAAVGPRWRAKAQSKMGISKSFTLEADGKAMSFGVGFTIPEQASAVALRYEGPVTIYVPLR